MAALIKHSFYESIQNRSINRHVFSVFMHFNYTHVVGGKLRKEGVYSCGEVERWLLIYSNSISIIISLSVD